jgi:hypothetical protein
MHTRQHPMGKMYEIAMRRDWNKNTASMLLDFAERYISLFVLVFFSKSILNMRRKSSFNYPAGWICRIICSFCQWIICILKNRTSRRKTIIYILKFDYFYFEIKPPPTGSASRIDGCSLREVTTCCQTVLASRLVLFGLRLYMSIKRN